MIGMSGFYDVVWPVMQMSPYTVYGGKISMESYMDLISMASFEGLGLGDRFTRFGENYKFNFVVHYYVEN